MFCTKDSSFCSGIQNELISYNEISFLIKEIVGVKFVFSSQKSK